MSYRALAWLPVVLVALFVVAALAAGEPSLGSVLATESEAGKLLALAGFTAAALAFDPRDYLRRAWLLAAACDALLLASDVVSQPSVAHRLSLATHAIPIAHALLAALANASSVASTWMLARAWSVAGLEEDADSRSHRRLLFVGGAAAALAITGWPLLRDARALQRGELEAAVSIASDLGDTACLALLAPVVDTVLALRGGLLRWPWGLLAASMVAWLAYDAGTGVLDALQLTAAPWLVGVESVRVLACGYGFCAGLAQRRVVSTR